MAYHFQISARFLSWPRRCACCGDNADSNMRASASRTTGKRVQNTTTSWWEVPYCSSCLSHKSSYESAGLWLAGGLLAGIASWIYIAYDSGNGTVGFSVALTVLSASFWPYRTARARARGQMKTSCCAPGAAVRYVKWHGTFHTFVFESEAYTNDFLEANGKKTRSDVTQV